MMMIMLKKYEGNGIPILIGALRTILKRLIRGLEDLEIEEETIKTTLLLTSARILRRLEGTYCHSNFCEKSTANTGVKKKKKKNLLKEKNNGMSIRIVLPKIESAVGVS